MKTAVLISGQLRTFGKCYPTQKFQIFRHYEPDIHFFVSLGEVVCQPIGDLSALSAESILLPDYKNVEVESYVDPTDLPVIPIQTGQHAPYANATTHPKLLLQHWGNKRVWDFFVSKADPGSFDTVIRIRPDLWIHRFQMPPGTPYFKIDSKAAYLPWWGKFGGVNDRLAIMGREAASVYFNTYDAIPQLIEQGCPFHPETLVDCNLRMKGMNVQNSLMTEFSTERMDGSRRWAEIVMSDIAELIANK